MMISISVHEMPRHNHRGHPVLTRGYCHHPVETHCCASALYCCHPVETHRRASQLYYYQIKRTAVRLYIKIICHMIIRRTAVRLYWIFNPQNGMNMIGHNHERITKQSRSDFK